MRRAGSALAVLALLGGCKLIDQRTFERAPTGPAAAQLARPDLPPLPLLTINPSKPDADWRTALADAVLAAGARKPDVSFEVVTPIPTSAKQPVQDDYARNGQADAQVVATALQSDGVLPERISLRFQGDPGAPAREVRLYVR